GARAPFEIRHVNVVMALVIVGTLTLVHSPVLDFKRIAVTSQAARALRGEGDVDFNYLRHHAGRHGILALQALSASGSSVVSERARIALAEVNRGALLAGSRDLATDRSRLRARVEVYPRGSRLPDDLVERLLVVLGTQRWRLACVDAGPTCAVILIDLDGD